jgi:SAM-dependent methyltransferase
MSDARPPAAFSDDYHNCVFRDGKLIGDFDAMYRHSREVPWHQDELARSWQAEVALAALAAAAPYESILEIGCGLGYFADRLATFGPVDGFDVSAEAVKRAAARSNRIHVYQDDILAADFAPRRRYALVVLRDVLWYVCHSLDRVLDNLDRCVDSAGYVAVIQSFPRLDRPFVGRDVIEGPDALVKHFSGYRLRRSVVLINHDDEADGPVVCLLLAV